TSTQIVTVNNVAPSIAISGNASVNEGSAYSLTLGAVTDPGTDTVTSYVVHWGDGSSNTYSSNGDKSQNYADGPKDYNVTVDLVDEDGTFLDRANAFSVHVNNVAPTATLSSNGPISEGSSATISFSGQSDPSTADTSAGFRYEYRCDGSAFPGPVNYGSASTSASTSCSFNDNGSYTVRARIIDKDNGANEYTTTVTVNNVKPAVTAAANQSSSE